MKGLIYNIYDLTTSKTARSLSIGMMVILCLLSSCSIRKGVAAFYSDQVAAAFQKNANSSLIQKQNLAYSSADCKLVGQGIDDTLVSIKQASSPFAMLPFLFLIVPEFLLSILIGIKIPTLLPVPNSWLRWTYLPLFLQNRLLLI